MNYVEIMLGYMYVPLNMNSAKEVKATCAHF